MQSGWNLMQLQAGMKLQAGAGRSGSKRSRTFSAYCTVWTADCMSHLYMRTSWRVLLIFT